jgi:hypothetical protein
MDFTKDFELVTLDLTTATGVTYNLRFIMVEINVYEDIWSNNITCDIVINDAKNQLMNMPIFGYETLNLEFRTPEKGLWSKTLRLVRITDRKLLRERELGYVLHFITPEAVTNLKTRVSKSYKGKLISDIVDDLHNNWLGGGPIDIETTKFQHHIIIPNIAPIHAINWLTTHANPAGYEGSNYLYYEDKDKFRFVTMESRLEKGPVKTYLFQVANVRKDEVGHKPQDFSTNVVAVEAYTFDHHSDILDNMKTGMYGNELLTHSHSRKVWRRYTFDYPGSFDQYKHLYPSNYLESRAKQDTNKKDSKLKLHSTGHDQDGYEFRVDKWLPVRISQLQQLHNIKLTITVPGDSERTVGEVVLFNLPSPEPPVNNNQIDDKYYQGKYLVQSVRHIIDVDKYRTVMELVKDSVFTQYP